MIYAKPATALVVVFRAYLASDHVTPATGKTIAITISKNGGAFGNPNAGATNATEMSSGFYKVTLDTTDTGTAGPLAVRGAVATVDDVGAIFYVGQSPADVTHWLGTATPAPGTAGVPSVDAIRVSTSATAADNLETAALAYSATRGLAGTALPAAAAGAAGGIPLSTAGSLDLDAQRADVAAILVDTGTTLDGRIPAALVGGRMDANVGAISADATAADNAEAFFDGTGYAGTGNVIPTVTTLTGHTAQTGDCFARLGAPAGASVSADVAAVKTDTGNLVTRITANLFAGITKMAEWLGLIAGKQTGDATARTEIRATGAGSGTYDETTDSTQAIRDRGDAAWTTATGFSTHSAADVWAAATRTLTANTNFNDPTAATIAAAVVGETMTELAAIPSASPTLKQAVALLYMALRNKVTVSATAKVIHNDAGTALGTKALSDDGTTYTEAEIA